MVAGDERLWLCGCVCILLSTLQFILMSYWFQTERDPGPFPAEFARGFVSTSRGRIRPILQRPSRTEDGSIDWNGATTTL